MLSSKSPSSVSVKSPKAGHEIIAIDIHNVTSMLTYHFWHAFIPLCISFDAKFLHR